MTEQHVSYRGLQRIHFMIQQHRHINITVCIGFMTVVITWQGVTYSLYAWYSKIHIHEKVQQLISYISGTVKYPVFGNSNMFGICYNNIFIAWHSYIITSRLQCSNKCIEDANVTFIVRHQQHRFQGESDRWHVLLSYCFVGLLWRRYLAFFLIFLNILSDIYIYYLLGNFIWKLSVKKYSLMALSLIRTNSVWQVKILSQIQAKPIEGS